MLQDLPPKPVASAYPPSLQMFWTTVSHLCKVKDARTIALFSLLHWIDTTLGTIHKAVDLKIHAGFCASWGPSKESRLGQASRKGRRVQDLGNEESTPEPSFREAKPKILKAL